MGIFYWSTIVFLLLNLLLGLVRVVRGPEPADRVLAAQLFGTVGVAILLLLARAQDEPALRDVGLVLALAAPLVAISFAGAQRDGSSRNEEAGIGGRE